MRILFISQLFDPEYSIKGAALMKNWADKGHEVEVLTTFPNYPTGKVFDGYKLKLKSIEMRDGVKVVRLWSHISHSKSKLSRALTYISFTLMAFFYSLFTKKPDLIYAYHPQIMTGSIGVFSKIFRKIPFVTDIQDLWPDSLIALGVGEDSIVVKCAGWWCKKIYHYADRIVVLSNGFKEALIDRGVEYSKIAVIYNWCPEEELVEKVIKESNYSLGMTKPFSLVYAGNVGSAQALAYVIDAVSLIPPDLIRFDVYGAGVELELLKKHVERKDIGNVRFMGYVPPSEIFYKLDTADLLLVHLKNQELFKITIPSKTQSSMAIGKPMVIAVEGEANAIVEAAKAGFVAEPCSVESIYSALIFALDNTQLWGEMGKNAREYYLREFSSVVNYKRLDHVLKESVYVDTKR